MIGQIVSNREIAFILNRTGGGGEYIERGGGAFAQSWTILGTLSPIFWNWEEIPEFHEIRGSRPDLFCKPFVPKFPESWRSLREIRDPAFSSLI